MLIVPIPPVTDSELSNKRRTLLRNLEYGQRNRSLTASQCMVGSNGGKNGGGNEESICTIPTDIGVVILIVKTLGDTAESIELVFILSLVDAPFLPTTSKSRATTTEDGCHDEKDYHYKVCRETAAGVKV